MINLKPIFDPSFWFDLTPVALSPVFEKGFFLFFAGMILFGAVARIVAKNKKGDRYLVQTYRKIAVMLITMGFAGLVFFFFTYEELYIFGARFWFLFWAIGLIAWAVSIVRFVKVKVPQAKEDSAMKSAFNKYIPRKKGK